MKLISDKEQKINTNSFHQYLENTIDGALCYKTSCQTFGDLFV